MRYVSNTSSIKYKYLQHQWLGQDNSVIKLEVGIAQHHDFPCAFHINPYLSMALGKLHYLI